MAKYGWKWPSLFDPDAEVARVTRALRPAGVQASDNIQDRQLLADLERVVERSRNELAVLLAEADEPADIAKPS